MRVSNNTPSFGIRLKTIAVFETTAQRIVSGNGLENPKTVINALYTKNLKAPGNRGFKGMSQDIAKAIFKKYPEVEIYTEKLQKAQPKELESVISEINEKFGKEMDIVL